jgi:4-hydroxy-tetrahydrodipicolinate synthase
METKPLHLWKGVHSALVTPFSSDGEVDMNALSNLMIQQKADGIHGFVMAGSTGEAPTLSIDERIAIVKLAREIAGSSMVVTAGAGSYCTRTAIKWQKIMEDAGADATLQVVPYYNKPTQDGLMAHFSAIAEQASVPIILYNAAGRTGIDIHPSTVAKIAAHNPQIIGIKDANINVERLIDLIAMCRKVRPDFLLLSGEDSGFFPFLALGGDGVISVSSQIAANEMLTLYKCFNQGELSYAQKIAGRLNGLFKLVFSHSNPIPIKTILSAMGMMEKVWRLPLTPISEADEQILLERCRTYDFIKSFKSSGFLT